MKSLSYFEICRPFMEYDRSEVRHWSLSWTKGIRSQSNHPICLGVVLILKSPFRLGLPSLLFPSDFPIKISYVFHYFFHTCYMLLLFYLRWSDQPMINHQPVLVSSAFTSMPISLPEYNTPSVFLLCNIYFSSINWTFQKNSESSQSSDLSSIATPIRSNMQGHLGVIY